MSKNQHIQDRARKEILDVLEKHNGEISIESLAEMKFLNQVIDGKFFNLFEIRKEILLLF